MSFATATFRSGGSLWRARLCFPARYGLECRLCRLLQLVAPSILFGAVDGTACFAKGLLGQ